MDPFTLFALANGAVSAIKKGCQLYKDIKGAAGDVKAVLKDLDEQFHANHPPDNPPTTAQRNTYIEEKNRVIELNKKANSGENTNVYSQIGEELGKYYDNYYKCVAIFDEEEKRAKTQVYTGDASLGKRALQRILMRKQLEEMGKELRETMVYQSPPELGALYSEVSEMMEQMGKEQQVLISKKMREDHANEIKLKKRIDKMWLQATWGIGMIIVCAGIGIGMALVVEDRIKKYPHLGEDWIPKTEAQRIKDAQPKVYTGR